MFAVLSFLGKAGLNFLKKGVSLLVKKTSSYLLTKTLSLNRDFQRKKEEKERRLIQTKLLQNLNLGKKPSLFNRLRSDQTLLISVVCTLGLLIILLLGGADFLLSALSLAVF